MSIPADINTADTGDFDADEITITTTASRVHCDGGGGSLGHPRIWLTIGMDGREQCPYCSRVFVRSREFDDGGDADGDGSGV